MKLDINFLNQLDYQEIPLKDIEIEMTPTTENTDQDIDQNCGLGIKGHKPLTEAALKQLCSCLKIPYPFTKQLRVQGKVHVLSYIQRQLSQATHASVILVSGETTILSVTQEEYIHYRGSEAISFDRKLTAILGSLDSPLELTDIICNNGSISYVMFYKNIEDISDTQYRWGFILSHSVLGDIEPAIDVVIKSMSDASHLILPPKLYSSSLGFEFEFEDRWNHIAAFIQNPWEPNWMTFTSRLGCAKKTTASFREIKDARRILSKLRIDKEDNELMPRIDKELQWKRIKEEYNIKDLPEPPNKLWYTRATTPLTCNDVITLLMKEGTHAINSIPYDIKRNIQLHAGSLLMTTSDLSTIQTPPLITW